MNYISPYWHQSIEISYTLTGKIDQFFLVANTMEVHSIYVLPAAD